MLVHRLQSALLIAFWYTCNILVILSNKYLLANYGFKFPVSLTASKVVPRQHIHSRWQLVKIALLAVVFCLTIVMGNISLRYIPVSFNQAIGATTPFFTALLSVVMTKRNESAIVYAALVPVVVGIIAASGGEPLFDLIGFLAALTATCGRAFKSVLQGLLLSDSSEKMDSMNLLLHMAPLAAIFLVPIVAFAEQGVIAFIGQRLVDDRRFLPALAFNATLAFLANLSNFVITKHTSALTLQVLGNAKGVVAAGISILMFRNPVTTQGATGYAIALFGVALYTYAKGQPQMPASTAVIDPFREKKELLPASSQQSLREETPISGLPDLEAGTRLSPARARDDVRYRKGLDLESETND